MISVVALAAAAATPVPKKEPVHTHLEIDNRDLGISLAGKSDLSVSVLADAESAVFQRKLGECVVAERERNVLHAISSSNSYAWLGGLNDGAGQRIVKLLDMRSCLARANDIQDHVMQFRWPSLRMTLVEAIYRKKFPTLPNVDWATKAAMPVVEVGDKEHVEFAKAAGAFGECVVRADPAAADAFIRSLPSSEDEALRLKAVAPRLSNCLNAGNTMKVTKTTLRMMVSDALWRLSSGYGLLAAEKQ